MRALIGLAVLTALVQNGLEITAVHNAALDKTANPKGSSCGFF
jgi:hypothetical protein